MTRFRWLAAEYHVRYSNQTYLRDKVGFLVGKSDDLGLETATVWQVLAISKVQRYA